MDSQPLDAEALRKLDAYWRAANDLSVGQIYLFDNPLQREPLGAEHVKPRLLGSSAPRLLGSSATRARLPASTSCTPTSTASSSAIDTCGEDMPDVCDWKGDL